MEKFIEKIEEYNLFNYLLPGIIFSYALKYYIGIDIVQSNIFEMLFIYYFVGSVISRIGSVFIEKLLIKIKYITYTPYKDYVEASKKDQFITRMLISNNMYRTILSGAITILVLKVIQFIANYFSITQDLYFTILIVFLIILYLLSYRKQTRYIFNRVKKEK